VSAGENRLLVLGLDGATFDVLLPMVEKGELPSIKKLMDGGAWGRMRTVIPPGTGPAWSSIVTGLDPSNHGIFDIIVRAKDSYNLAFLNGASLRAAAVWDIVGKFGGKVVVLNVPMTYPPRQVNGYLVTGLLTPLGSGQYTFPPELASEIKSKAPSYRIVPQKVYSAGRAGDFLEELREVLESKRVVLKDLLGRTDWKFAMEVFSETDFLQHALWHVMDEKHPRHDPEEAARFLDEVRDIYRRLDSIIGEVVETLGENDSVMLVSDHGAGPLHRFVHANNYLIQQGAMKIKGGVASRLKFMLFKAGLTPMNVYRLVSRLRLGRVKMGLRWTSGGYDLLRRFFFSFSDVDWEHTKAYALSGGVYGGLFVNLKGREPRGSVEPEDYEKVRGDLADLLRELRDPRTDRPLISEVIKREDIYSGRFVGEAPDLYFLPYVPTVGVFGDFEFSSSKLIEEVSDAISAQHRMEGIFVASGPALRKGHEVSVMSVLDLAPLMLYLMNLPIPEGVDGKLMKDVLDEAGLKGRPPEYAKMKDLYGAGDRDRDSTEDESIRDRLKGLGYIS
jgi:predicted AlkP superfamily phosphohydrolase/phosphomutase